MVGITAWLSHIIDWYFLQITSVTLLWLLSTFWLVAVLQASPTTLHDGAGGVVFRKVLLHNTNIEQISQCIILLILCLLFEHQYVMCYAPVGPSSGR